MTTKPQGETPLTDAAVLDWAATDDDCVRAEFARTLERARSECREELEREKRKYLLLTKQTCRAEDRAELAESRLASREGADLICPMTAAVCFDPRGECHLGHCRRQLAPFPADGLADKLESIRDSYSELLTCVKGNMDIILAALRSRQAPRGEGK